MAILAVSVLAAIWAVAMMTAPGRIGYYYFFIYAEFYMGVLALVSLSITIMVGLIATDRLVLSIRQRVLLQSAHRTTGLIAVLSLFVHVWTKEVEHHIRLIDAFIPFLSPFNRLYIGFGTISGLIMVLVMWTGLARARFIGQGKPWMWRSVHAISYLMWPIALVHGLAAGRAAKAWVIVSYIICILLVLIGLAVRLSVSFNRRKDFASTSTGALKPVGKLVPTSAPAAKKRPSRREQEVAAVDSLGPVAVLDTWVPAAPPAAPVTGAPAMSGPRPPRGRQFAEDEEPMPVPRQRALRDEDFFDEPTRGRRRVEADFDYDEEPRPARGRRYADDDLSDTSTRMRRDDIGDTSTRMRRDDIGDTSTRMRRVDMDDTSTRMRRVEMDDTSTRMRRVEMDDTSTRMRRADLDDGRSARPDYDQPTGRTRRYVEDDEPAPRSRRRAEEPLYDETPQGRRRADDDYDVPRQRGSRYGADARYGREEEDAPRARRDRGADIDRADSGRHSRSEFVDFEDPNYLEPDETPTLVDMASRRARRASQAAGPEAVRGQASRGARRGGRGRAGDDVADDRYWSQLRGEAN